MIQQVQTGPDIHEISLKGQKILEALSEELKEEHWGRFIAIDVDAGDYFVGETAVEANRKARAEHPGRIFFLGRIGYRTAYTFKERR